MLSAQTAFLVLPHGRSPRQLGINLRELRTLVEECAARRVFVFLDACRSGAIGQVPHALAANSIVPVTVSLDAPAHRTKLIVASSPASQRSKEADRYGHSVFTHHLLRGTRDAIARAAPLTPSQLFGALADGAREDAHPPPVRIGIEVGSEPFRPADLGPCDPASELRAAPGAGWRAATAGPLAPAPGDDSRFVRDDTYPDGAFVPIGARIVKAWTVRNVGTVPWRDRYLQRHGADRGTGVIESPPLIPIPDTDPGQDVRIEARLGMPPTPATVMARFRMVDAAGRLCFPTKEGLRIVLNVYDPNDSESSPDPARS